MFYLYIAIGLLWVAYKYKIKIDDIKRFEESLSVNSQTTIACKAAAFVTAIFLWPVSILLTLTKGTKQ